MYTLRLILSKIAYRIHLLAMEREQIHKSVANLKKDLKEGNLHRTDYVDHYDEQHELEVWEKYRAMIVSGQEIEITFRLRYVRDRIKELPVSRVLDFGCSYGWLEGQIPGMIGIDRSEEAMRRNRAEFPNNEFVVGDVFECLSSHKIDAFCHINVGTYFLPTFIAKLYAAARDSGAEYLIAFEPSGISRQTNRYYNYTTEPQDSVVFRGPMLLNNYPQLMKDAGYSLVHSAILKPPHPHADYRSACFIARSTPH